MNFGHGGNVGLLAERAGLPREEILDFSASINPQGPPGHLRSLVNRSLEDVIHYPDPYASGLAAAIADHHDLSSRQIVVGNGSTEILFALPRVLGVSAAVIPVPSYLDYRTAATREGLHVEVVALNEVDGFAIPWTALEKKLKGSEMVILGQPNNPTGRLFDNDRLADLADRHLEQPYPGEGVRPDDAERADLAFRAHRHHVAVRVINRQLHEAGEARHVALEIRRAVKGTVLRPCPLAHFRQALRAAYQDTFWQRRNREGMGQIAYHVHIALRQLIALPQQPVSEQHILL